MTINDQALAWMDLQEPDTLYDPESMTFDQQRAALEKVYQYCYPYHNTDQAYAYDYPTFDQAVREWSKDEFYRQHLIAKLYCDTLDWIFEEPINAWQYSEE